MPFDHSKATATAVGQRQVDAILARRKVALAKRSSAGGAYQKMWGNELHPTEDGFSLVAGKFSGLIDALHPA